MQLTDVGGNGNDARLLFGKVGDDQFNIDFSTPFSALQAFAFSLAVFESSSDRITYSLAQGFARKALPLCGSARARRKKSSTGQSEASTVEASPPGDQSVQSI